MALGWNHTITYLRLGSTIRSGKLFLNIIQVQQLRELNKKLNVLCKPSMSMNTKIVPSFYKFGSEGYLTTFFVSPDLFENAIENNLFGPESGREIHHQLLYGDDSGSYPKYIEFPVVYRHEEGKKMRDMLDMRFDGHCFLISDRMKLLMEDNGITGWKSYPVLVYDKKGNEIKGYHGFTVTGRGGEMRFLMPPNQIPYGESSHYCQWEQDQWDGSDIFRIRPNYLIVTKRTMLLFKENKITSPHFYPLSESATIL